MSLTAALVGGGIAALGGLGSSLINKSAAKQNTKLAAELEWKYYKKQRELDLSYDTGPYFDLDKAYAQYNYDLSRRYAENSSKWMVQGLRNANLNPILAATDGNFRGTFGDAMSRSGSSGNSAAVHAQAPKWSMEDLGTAALSGARNAVAMENTEANTVNQQKQAELNEANAEMVRSDTLKKQIEAANAAENGGYTGFASQIFNAAKSTLLGVDTPLVKGISSFLQSGAKKFEESPLSKFTPDKAVEGARKIYDKAKSFFGSGSSGSSGGRSVDGNSFNRPVGSAFKKLTGYGSPRFKVVPKKPNSNFFR